MTLVVRGDDAAMLDYRAEANTDVEVKIDVSFGDPSKLTLWVNIDGACRLRLTGLRPEVVTVIDRRPRNV